MTRQKNLILLLFFALAFVCGAVSVYLIPSYQHVVFGVIIAVVAAIWCNIDSQQHQRPLSRGKFVGILALPIIFVPAYLLMSRGPKGFIGILAFLVIVSFGALLAVVGAMLATSWAQSG